MKLYIDKLREIRKSKKITSEELSQKMGISRLTLCAWENAKRVPSEPKIRMLARVLDISVDKISDLVPDTPISDMDLSIVDSTITSLLGTDSNKNKERLSSIISKIFSMDKELSDARLIIDAMLSSIPSMFYIKDSSLKFITANTAFLNNLSLNKNFSVFGKVDSDFFSQHEAKINYDTDKKVLAEGKGFLDHEGYIPGSRKTRWGIISKSPIFDSTGKAAGVLGSFVDITTRKLNEEVREILENNINEWQNCMTIYDLTKKRYVFVSKAIEKITGYKIENFYNIQNFSLTTCVHPDDKHLLTPFAVRKPEEYSIHTYRIVRPDNSIRKITTEIFPGKKEYLDKYLITLSEDITDKT